MRRRLELPEVDCRMSVAGDERRFFTAEAPDCTSGRWDCPGCCANPASLSTDLEEKAGCVRSLHAGLRVNSGLEHQTAISTGVATPVFRS